MNQARNIAKYLIQGVRRLTFWAHRQRGRDAVTKAARDQRKEFRMQPSTTFNLFYCLLCKE